MEISQKFQLELGSRWFSHCLLDFQRPGIYYGSWRYEISLKFHLNKEYGQLGIGENVGNRSSPILVEFLMGKFVKTIGAGWYRIGGNFVEISGGIPLQCVQQIFQQKKPLNWKKLKRYVNFKLKEMK